jgi:hypothetical protein
MNFFMRCCNRRSNRNGATSPANVAAGCARGSVVNEADNTREERIAFIKVPVVLAEFTVQIDLNAVVNLARRATSVDEIDKNVVVTQAKLVAGTNRLFITGYVNEDIEYSTVSSTNGRCTIGPVFHTTANIPFTVVTPVDFEHCRYPKLRHSKDQKETFYNTCGCRNTRDLTRVDRFEQEVFNEPVRAEVLSANIFEADINQMIQTLPNGQPVFRQITQDIVIYLTIRLLQDQAVREHHHPRPHVGRDEEDFENDEENDDMDVEELYDDGPEPGPEF